MDWNDLPKEPTMSVRDTIKELQLLAGTYDPWKTAEDFYHYDPSNTTLKQVSEYKGTLKARQAEAAQNIVRYIYRFWVRMLEWGGDAVSTAQYYAKGFTVVESPEQVAETLVRSKQHPAFPWHWEEATWRVVHRPVYGKKEYGEQEILSCCVTCWVRDHDEEWEFSIPVKFLEPDYDFKADAMFVDDLDQTRYNSIYSTLFRLNDLKQQREIIQSLPQELVERILAINGHHLPEEYRDLISAPNTSFVYVLHRFAYEAQCNSHEDIEVFSSLEKARARLNEVKGYFADGVVQESTEDTFSGNRGDWSYYYFINKHDVL